jgi:NAD(P) transhydrogenase
LSTAQYDVVVIGGGPGGQKAAVQAAKAGNDVLLVERATAVGGECVHRGTIPSKTLRQSALNYRRWFRDFGAGAPPHRFDKAFGGLMNRLEQVLAAHEEFMTRQLDRNGIDVWRGRASFLSPHDVAVVAADGTSRRANGEFVVIATGSRPRTPPNVPVDHEHVLDSDSILSLAYLPDSLAVLGSGVIACEFASIFAALGVRVTLIDKAERPLAFLDAELTARFVAELESMGGAFLGKRTFASVEYDGLSQVVTKLDGGEVVRSSKLLCALGRVAQLGGLALERAGLAPNERGLLDADEHCRTVVPHIYAVGDVIGPPALAATSMEQGRRAMRHALELGDELAPSTTPAGIYTIPEISSVGLTAAEARARHGEVIVGRARFEELARGHINGDANGLLKLVCDASGRKVLGCQIIGEGATELVHLAQMALANELDVDTFVDQIFNFPTFAEAYLVATLDVAAQRGAGLRKVG